MKKMNLIHPNLINRAFRNANVDDRIVATEDDEGDMKLEHGDMTTEEVVSALVNGLLFTFVAGGYEHG